MFSRCCEEAWSHILSCDLAQLCYSHRNERLSSCCQSLPPSMGKFQPWGLSPWGNSTAVSGVGPSVVWWLCVREKPQRKDSSSASQGVSVEGRSELSDCSVVVMFVVCLICICKQFSFKVQETFVALNWKDLESWEAVALKLFVVALQYMQHMNRVRSGQHMGTPKCASDEGFRKGYVLSSPLIRAKAPHVHGIDQFVEVWHKIWRGYGLLFLKQPMVGLACLWIQHVPKRCTVPLLGQRGLKAPFPSLQRLPQPHGRVLSHHAASWGFCFVWGLEFFFLNT